MWANVAAKFNGVEKTLASLLVALVDVPVLSKTGAVLCLTRQIVEISIIESFHDLFRQSNHVSRDDLANRSINSKLLLKGAAETV